RSSRSSRRSRPHARRQLGRWRHAAPARRRAALTSPTRTRARTMVASASTGLVAASTLCARVFTKNFELSGSFSLASGVDWSQIAKSTKTRGGLLPGGGSRDVEQGGGDEADGEAGRS